MREPLLLRVWEAGAALNAAEAPLVPETLMEGGVTVTGKGEPVALEIVVVSVTVMESPDFTMLRLELRAVVVS